MTATETATETAAQNTLPASLFGSYQPAKFNRRPIAFPVGADADGLWYLVEVRQVRNGVRSDTASHYVATRAPGRTNLSNRPCVSGWLGSTSCGIYGTDRYAIGCYRVSRRSNGAWRFDEVNVEE